MSRLKSVRLTAPEVGLLLGLAVGVFDSFTLLTNWSVARGAYYLPPLWWLTVLWTWMTACCLTAVVFSSPRLSWLRGFALAFIGPGLLLVSRTATPMKRAWQLPSWQVLLICLAATIVLAFPLARIPLRPSAFWKRYLVGSVISTAVLTFLAADVRVADLLHKGKTHQSSARTTPNVVLIFLDTVRYDESLGSALGTTPNLMRFAARGAAFDNAWAPSPWTIPSHFAVFTGVDPWLAPFDPDTRTIAYDGPTMADRFHSRGYATAAVYANPLLTPDSVNGRGYSEISYSRASAVCRTAIGDLLSRTVFNDGPRMPLCSTYTASEVTARAIRFVSRTKSPYFLTVNYLDGHDPYYVERGCREPSFRALSRAERDPIVSANPDSHAPDLTIAKRVKAQYRHALNCMDRSLGRLLAAVERDPNTIIAIVGDHGEQFGRHGFGGHGNSVYRQVLHVPLAVRVPNQTPARIVDPVSITDLYLTILRAADPEREHESLPLFTAELRRPILSCFAYSGEGYYRARSGFSVVRDEFHFIHSDQGEELYAYPHDPAEVKPIPLHVHRELADTMREDILRMKRAAKPTTFNALGYLN